MIVILDTAKGKDYNFTTRKDAGEFIGVSRPTLRGWLKSPFYLHKSLIITHTSNEKVQRSKRALLKKKMAQFASEEIDRVGKAQEVERISVSNQSGDVRINNSRSVEPAEVERNE